jgi:hypothetical protein
MKRVKTVMVLSILLLLSNYIACKKGSSDKALTGIPSNQNSLISDSRKYFESEILPQKNKFNNGKSVFKPIRDLDKDVAWDKATIQRLSFGNAVVVPLLFNSRLHAQISGLDGGVRIGINNLHKLVIYKNELNAYHCEIVSSYPDQNYISNLNNPFTGLVLIQDWNGNVLRSFKHSNGKIVELTQAGTELQSIGSSPNIQQPPPSGNIATCYYTDWYTCTVDPNGTESCAYDFTQNEGCYTDLVSAGAWNGSSTPISSGDTYQIGAHGGLSNSPNTWGEVTTTGGTICGSYKYTTISNAFYTQFTAMGFSLVGNGSNAGNILTFTFPNPCFSFPISIVKSTPQADLALNAAWNYAVVKCVQDANSNSVIGDFQVKTNMKKYINNYLATNYPGATFNPGGCSGSIPYNKPVYCSIVP